MGKSPPDASADWHALSRSLDTVRDGGLRLTRHVFKPKAAWLGIWWSWSLPVLMDLLKEPGSPLQPSKQIRIRMKNGRMEGLKICEVPFECSARTSVSKERRHTVQVGQLFL